MAKDKKQQSSDDDLDLGSLSALVRPSVAPPSEQDSDGDDAKLDLRALVASVPPPAAVEAAVEARPAPVEAKAEPAKRDANAKKGGEAKKAEPKKNEAKPVAAKALVEATPAAPSAPASNNGLYIGLGVGLAVAVGVFFMTRPDTAGTPEPVTTASAPATTHAPVVEDRAPHGDTLAEAPTPPPTVEAPTEEPTVEDTAPAGALAEAPTAEAPTAEADPAPAVATTSPSASSRSSRRGSSSTASATVAVAPAPTATAEPTPAPAPSPRTATAPTPAPTGAHLDSVLDQALGSHPTTPRTTTTARTATTPAPSGAALPETPSQADVRRVLASVMPQIRTCAGEQVGLAVATLMVRSDGSVTSAAVGGSPFSGTPQGSCMEGALRGAHFPAFRQQTFRVQYPMSIRPAS